MVKTAGQQITLPKIIQGLWWLTLAMAVGWLFASLPGYFVHGIMPEPTSQADAWERILGWLAIAMSLSAAILSLGLAGLLYWKKRTEPMGLYLSFFLLLYAIIFCGPLESALDYWLPQFPHLGGQIQGLPFILPAVVLILIFPNGHFEPRRSRLLVYATAVLILIGLTLDPAEAVKINTPRAQLVGGLLYSTILVAIGIQGYRYRRLYAPSERQQTKWVAYGSLLYFTVLLFVSIPYYYLLNQPPEAQHPWWQSLMASGWWLGVNILPLSFTFAILRSRLWDIDVIIRRTLTYAVVTALLVIVFFGSIILLQRIFSALTGTGSNEIATVLSTLAIAALFVPLRNRVQSEIDKGFNRKKYDTQQVLNDFGNTVRDETDLEKLTERLIQVVNDTMQPRTVSVWLKQDAHK